MEPLAHEGFGRRLKLAGAETPLALDATPGAALLPGDGLADGGALRLGDREFALPPPPLGRDPRAQSLSLGDGVAVLEGAATREPRELAAALIAAREAAGYRRLLYAPAVDPVEMPLLAYLGVDVIDDLTTELRSVAGWEFYHGDWVRPPTPRDDLAVHNRRALARWLAHLRQAVGSGRLREAVERSALHHPRVTATLHHAREALAQRDSRLPRPLRAGALSLDHPAVMCFRRRLARIAPPAGGMVLLLLPCSARKPYHRSASHRRFRETLRTLPAWLRLHVVSVTSPLGLVPRELELAYPAAHYDIAVTGHWDGAERAMLARQVGRLRPEDHYISAIVHAGAVSGLLAELLRARGLTVFETGAERPASTEGLAQLREAAAAALAGQPPLSGAARGRGEVAAQARFQLGVLAEPLLTAPVRGRWPRLRLGELASTAPTLGGLALTLDGAAALAAAGGPVVEAGDFHLHGDLFAAGVTGSRDEWRVGDQVAVVQRGEVTAAGVAHMEPAEMVAMQHGLAVEVRHRG